MKRKYRTLLLLIPLLLTIHLTLSFAKNKATDSNTTLDFEKFNKITDETPDFESRPIYKYLKSNSNSINDNCLTYFQKLNELHPNWWMKPKIGKSFTHENTEMIQDLIHVNIYNKCFIDNSKININENIKKFTGPISNLDYKMYPYLSGKLPLFQNNHGKYFYGPESLPDLNLNNFNDLQNLKNDFFDISLIELDESINQFHIENIPYWNYYKNFLNGSGIVISINDNFVNDVIKLLKNLQFLGNYLPIQLIHRGDLSNLNKIKILNSYKNNNKIWFVDISHCINEKYSNEFNKYYNKLLAYTFNSFENMILLDNDIVLFENPVKLFNSNEFKISKSFFFKDRLLPYRMSSNFLNFLKKVSPNIFDNFFFGFNQIDNSFWLNNEYFQNNYFHYMESGLVVINKLKYWNGIILSTQLPFIQSTIIGSWGEKEFFWMSLLISGFNDYKFNNNWSALVGNLNNNNNICSSHPAHIVNDELIWINSNILNCPKFSNDLLIEDFNKLPNYNNFLNFDSIEDLEIWYKNPISFDYFIIPDVDNLNQLNLCDNYMWCSNINNGGTNKKFNNKLKSKYDKIASNYLL